MAADVTTRTLRSHKVPLANVSKKVAEVKKKNKQARTKRCEAVAQGSKWKWVGEPKPVTVSGAAVQRYKGVKFNGEEYRAGDWCVCVSVRGHDASW